ncbi:DUF3575 domain-containing protein [Pontibacter sp. Tf4]|uniref:DUF3575 domain-containing protein n=1 Tax=Pontibacter sp. Tf4 TaxID=2761620 RepID=UPI00162A0991|nr:DUF3575 domain-containing protein [Pontibacter sp. Tf4]MBB6610668.1 DUF3575 domain-containing protein [Pontibacter sp. Tf4]
MKHLFTTLALCFSAGLCAAQTDTTAAPVLSVDSANTLQTALAPARDSVVAPAPEVFRKNSIKMNLSSLAFSNYSFSYERAIARKITLVGGYSFMPETQISSIPVVDKALEMTSDTEGMDSDDFEDAFKKGNAAATAFTGEIRFYTGKKPGARGFYASLYGRYTTMDLSYLDVYEDALGMEHDLPYKASLKGLSGGIMLGAQWLIAKRVTFDWYIVGGHYGNVTGDMTAKVDLSMLSEQDKAELEQEVEDIFEYSDGKSYVDATVNDNGMFGKVKGPFGGIRAVGFNLGIAF